MNDTTVKYINESMRGAPVLKRGAGTLIGLLDTFLVNGWGLETATSANISAGVCTINMAVGKDFEAGAVVLVAGATPAAINGEHRLITGGTTLTFALDEADATATGTITVKYAPCGWEKVYAGTNLAVYRSPNVMGPRRYLRVADTNVDYARVVGYSAMTAVSTGTGPFPTGAQVSGGLYWHKTEGYTTTDQRYDCFGDDRFFVYAPAIQWAAAGGAAGCDNSRPWFFGEPIALDPAGDVYTTVIGGSTTSYWASQEGSLGIYQSSGTYAERAHGGSGASLATYLGAQSGITGTPSGADSKLGTFPDGISNALFCARQYVNKSTSDSAVRSIVPGAFSIPQIAVAHPTLQARDTVPGPGAMSNRRLLWLWMGAISREGAILIDLDGPWR